MAIKECESQGKGENIGGGCGSVAGYNQNYNDAADYDCELLKPTIEQYKQALNQAEVERSIGKYK